MCSLKNKEKNPSEDHRCDGLAYGDCLISRDRWCWYWNRYSTSRAYNTWTVVDRLNVRNEVWNSSVDARISSVGTTNACRCQTCQNPSVIVEGHDWTATVTLTGICERDVTSVSPKEVNHAENNLPFPPPDTPAQNCTLVLLISPLIHDCAFDATAWTVTCRRALGDIELPLASTPHPMATRLSFVRNGSTLVGGKQM